MKINKYVIALLLAPIFVSAQTATNTPPVAGLTPQSPFYFVDRLGEFLQELIAFSPETKIRLQVGFAAERIAEIQIEMQDKDVDAKGLSVAQERLEKHLSKASKLVDEEEKRGKDVSHWSEALKGEFEVSKKVLETSFEAAKDSLEDDIEAVKEELELAKKSGDTSKIEAFSQTLSSLKAEKEELETQKEVQKKSLEMEKKRLEDGDDEDEDIADELEDIEDDMNDDLEDIED